MAAFLTSGIVFGLGGVLGGKLIHSERPEHPAFAILSALPEGISAGPRAVPIAALLTHADPARGQSDAAKLCGACHSFTKGGATMVGPNLYNMVMAPIAAGDGYDFSSGLKAHKGKWTFDDMSAWLKDPKGYAPGTKMAFAGITNDRQRADVVDYLRTLSDGPLPLPPVPKEAPAGAAAAAGAPPAAPAGPSFAEEVGHADPKLGGAAAQRYCGACHSFDQGGASMVGPNLYNVVDKAIAVAPGYSFSAALTAKHAAWTYENLNAWLTSPRGFAPGTKMGFAGIPSEKQRAAVVDYLRTLSPNPHPVPGSGAGGADKPGQGAAKQSPGGTPPK
nr:c-type cytochrome [uncultured Lichenicoccus sp.]